MYYFIFQKQQKYDYYQRIEDFRFKCFAENQDEANKKVKELFPNDILVLIEQGELEPVYNLPVINVLEDNPSLFYPSTK